MPPDSIPTGDITDGPFLRDRYPGLRTEESRLLRQYLWERGTDDIKRLRTSVEVGPGEDVPQLEDNFREMAFRLSRWKIDAVIDYPGRTDIIELKSRATHTGLGQAVGYGFYLGQIDIERTNPRLLVVAFREHPAVRRFARAIGAEVHTVPDADVTTASRAHDVAESLEELRGRLPSRDPGT